MGERGDSDDGVDDLSQGQGRVEMSRRILVIDDDPDLLVILRGFLESDGFQVETAGGGEEGLRKSSATPPDLILLDLLMPGTNGIEVFKQLKEKPQTATIPVIFLTGIPDKEFAQTAIMLGADRFVAKPCDSRRLLSTVHEMLG